MYAVHADHVVVVRNGRNVALRFEGEAEGNPVGSPLPNERPVQAPGPVPVEPAAKAALRAAPVLLLQWLAVEPLMDRERLVGYKVGDSADASLMKDVQLMPGDIIAAVNGVHVEGMRQDAWMLSDSTSPAELWLTVYRQGRAERLRY